MTTAEPAASRPRAARITLRKVLRYVVLTSLWTGFFGWCWLVLLGPDVVQLFAALERLAVVLASYLVLLVAWINARTLIDRRRGVIYEDPLAEPAFTADYFGRQVALAPGASFSDQHLVLEYDGTKKVYRAAEHEDEVQVAAAASLESLAAAAGAYGGVRPQREAASEKGESRELEEVGEGRA